MQLEWQRQHTTQAQAALEQATAAAGKLQNSAAQAERMEGLWKQTCEELKEQGVQLVVAQQALSELQAKLSSISLGQVLLSL